MQEINIYIIGLENTGIMALPVNFHFHFAQ